MCGKWQNASPVIAKQDCSNLKAVLLVQQRLLTRRSASFKSGHVIQW